LLKSGKSRERRKRCWYFLWTMSTVLVYFSWLSFKDLSI